MDDFERKRTFRQLMEKYRHRRLTYAQRMDFDARFGIFEAAAREKKRYGIAAKKSIKPC